MEDEYSTKESMESAENWFTSNERKALMNQISCLPKPKDKLDYFTYNYNY